MKHRVLSVLAQAVLLATTAGYVSAQSRTSERVEEWQARSSRLANQLSPGVTAASQYGLAGIMRQLWNGDTWVTQSQTTHTYTGVIRYETLDYDWNFVVWQPTFRTIYRSDRLVDFIEVWDVANNKYIPSERYFYEFEYDFPSPKRSVSSILVQKWNGTGWVNSERTTNRIERDPIAGLVIGGGRTESWTGTAWTPVDDFSLEEVGDDVIQLYRLWIEGTQQWIDAERTTYSSNTIAGLYEKLNRATDEFENFGDLTIGLLMLPDFDAEIWDEDLGEWAPELRKATTAFHFTTGKPATVVYSTWNGIEWAEDMHHEIQYTVEGHFVKSQGKFGGAGSSDGFVEIYEYDHRGNLVEAVYSITDEDGEFDFARFLMGWTDLSVGTEDPGEIAKSHVLNPAYPNPFNPSTTITYELRGTDRVTVNVYDILGKRVATLVDAIQPAGTHQVVLDAAGLPSGLYSVQMRTTAAVQSRTVTLIK